VIDPYKGRPRPRASARQADPVLRISTPQSGGKATSRHGTSSAVRGDVKDGFLTGKSSPYSAAHKK